jgi:hypothetical protein
MSIFADLLFLHGHIADPALANQLAQPPAVVPGHHPEVPDATPEANPGPSQDAGYRPRSWRYPMALFHALDDSPAPATAFEAGGTRVGPATATALPGRSVSPASARRNTDDAAPATPDRPVLAQRTGVAGKPPRGRPARFSAAGERAPGNAGQRSPASRSIASRMSLKAALGRIASRTRARSGR